MSRRVLVALLPTVSLVLGLAVACGGSKSSGDTPTTPSSQEDAKAPSPDAAGADGDATEAGDGGTEASLPACVWSGADFHDPAGASDECAIYGSCPTCAGGFVYGCAGDQLPPIDGGCRAIDAGLLYAGWFCCEPACVRNRAADVACPDAGMKVWSCPIGDDGGALTATLPAKCQEVSNGSYSASWCCE